MSTRPAKKARTEEGKTINYISGFGNEHSTEALEGALPVGCNSPQKCPYGLYAEQLSGTAFTKPRAGNERSWLYRQRPTCQHPPMKPYGKASRIVADFSNAVVNPNQLRWKPFKEAAAGAEKVDFLDGMKTLAGAGSAESKSGLAIHMYACNTPMTNRAMVNSDGDLLIVPEKGDLLVRTEMGTLEVPNGVICVVPRGIRFSVLFTDGEVSHRGYILEIFEGHFVIPDLGPIGANGLANPSDFEYPTAAYDEECKVGYELVYKFAGKLFSYTQEHSPFDVVAWRGNYAPYRYDLAKYCVINSVAFDHIDPSVFTVLTCQTLEPGVACADFVIFPPRWAVQEKTFRPPYYHRNCMSEFMGNLKGAYDAKPGFTPGSASLHSCMVGHGPSAAVFEGASNAALTPQKMPETDMSFMFESTYIFRLTHFAEHEAEQDKDYYKVWEPIKSHFDPNNIEGC